MKKLNISSFGCSKFLASCFILFQMQLNAQTSVLTQHNDIKRTGWNNQETQLNTRNVKPGSFGKLFSFNVDDQIYAQPLVIPSINISGIGQRNLVIVATVNNTVYAFDADSASDGLPYWKTNLTAVASRAVKNTDMTGSCGGGYRDFSGNMGIVGTPVIDPNSNTIYLVARSLNTSNNSYSQYLHALDIRTGAEQPNSPKLITAAVPGNGDGNVGGMVNFDPQKQNQRPGLLLLNNSVFITWASHCDWGPYHGWIMGYDKTSLQQQYVYNTTPNGYNGGIWMSGGGPSADENGNIYAAVGNGSVGFNNNPSDPINRSESALKLTPNNNGGLTVNSFFTPKNISDLEAADLDFGVTEMLLIPGTNRVMTACKDGRIYLLDRDNMGGFNSTFNNVLQTIDLGTNAHLRSSFAYYQGEQKEFVYTWSENALLKALPYDRTTSLFDLGNVISSGSQGPIGNNGAFLAVSSNGSADSTAILWASHAANGDANQSVRPGILRAFYANDVTKEIWNSSMVSTDQPGNFAKFNCPTIANGKVYLATFSNNLVIYGLNGSQKDTCIGINIALNKTIKATSSLTPESFAVDGDPSTAWTSATSDPQSFVISLGSRYDLCKVGLKWSNVPGKDFSIDVSEDSLNWRSVIAISANSDSEILLPIKGTGRFVRWTGYSRNGTAGYSLNEFELFGRPNANSCAEPDGLEANTIYENTANIQWNANGGKHFRIFYKTVSASTWNTVNTDSTSYTLTGLSCASDYLFEVQTLCSTTDSSIMSFSSFSTIPCNSNCGPLPTRWTTLDIGDVDASGSACFNAGVFELKGAGADIWDTEDGFRFAYKTLVGDGEFIARVTSMDQINPWNKCGIMIRESLSPGSRHAFIALTSGNGVAFQNRNNTDGYSDNVNSGPGITAPYWLKLVKKGSIYTAYASTDGKSWFSVGNPVDAGFGIDIPVYAGLALTSHVIDQISVATVDNFSFSGILEVELLSFTAQLGLDQTVNLQWVTTLEKGIVNFVLERSADNVHYSQISEKPAVNNGRYTQTYNDVDKTPLPNFNYYRLRILNSNGAIKYSAPVFVRMGTGTAPLLFPNPARSVVHVAQGTESIVYINMYDISGRMVSSVKGNSGITDVPILSLPNGIYILEIRTSTTAYRGKLMIQN